MKKTLVFAASALMAAAAFSACTKSDDIPAAPEVSAVVAETSTKTLTFTITPVNAVKCAWMLVAEDAEIPSAETVLAEGVPAHANEPSTVVKDGLKALTSYNFVVAVANVDKATSYFILETTTADVPAVEFDADKASGRKYGGSTVNFGVTLKAKFEDVDYELSLDVYDSNDSESAYMQPGTYVFSSEKEGKTLGSYCFIYINNKMYQFVSGTMTVEINEDKTYSLDIRLVTTNTEESSFHGVFRGNIDGFDVQ